MKRNNTDSNRYQKGYTLIGLIYVVIAITSIIGWVANIVKLTGCDFSNIGAEIVLRVVGIFVAPLGVILGLFFGHF
jgi:hypothetical protein